VAMANAQLQFNFLGNKDLAILRAYNNYIIVWILLEKKRKVSIPLAKQPPTKGS